MRVAIVATCHGTYVMIRANRQVMHDDEAAPDSGMEWPTLQGRIAKNKKSPEIEFVVPEEEVHEVLKGRRQSLLRPIESQWACWDSSGKSLWGGPSDVESARYSDELRETVEKLLIRPFDKVNRLPRTVVLDWWLRVHGC